MVPKEYTNVNNIFNLNKPPPPPPPPFNVKPPMFLNPCSVAEVFRTIGERAGIAQYRNGQQKCMIIICDGLPFSRYSSDYNFVKRYGRYENCATISDVGEIM